MIKMTKEICIMCKEEVDQYVNSYKDQGVICLKCYYGSSNYCYCEYCNKNFDIKLFDTLRERVVCPVCKRKNYIKEQGGLIHEDLSMIKIIPHDNSYFFKMPEMLNKYMNKIEKKYVNKSRELLIFTAISEFVQSKIKKLTVEEKRELMPRKYTRRVDF